MVSGPLILIILVSSAFLGKANGLRLNHDVPPDEANQYRWVFILYIVLGGIGVIYNGLTISMMLLLRNKKRFTFYTLNICINICDTAFDSFLIALGVIHLLDFEFSSLGCFIESVIELVLQVWIINILAGISWVVRYDICEGKRFSQKAMVLYSIATLIYCTVIGFISTYVGGYKLQTSGTFCFTDISNIFAVLFFCLCTVTIPRLFVIYNLRITNKIIMTAQKELETLGIQEQAKANYIRMVKKLNILVLVTMTSFFPVIAAAVYQFITNQYVSPAFSIFVQLNVTLVSCIGNPTLFFYLNAELRYKLYECIISLLQYLGLFRLVKNTINSRYRRRRSSLINFPLVAVELRKSLQRVSIHPTMNSQWLKYPNSNASDLESSHQIDYKKYYGDINNWMSDPELFKAFKEEGRRDYALENFLFYEDVRIYQTMGCELLDRFKDFRCVLRDIDNLEKNWSEIEKFGLRIYNLYIKIPTSPLEINIPYSKKIAIWKIFKRTGDMQPSTSYRLPISMTLSSPKSAVVNYDDKIFPTLKTLINNYGTTLAVDEIEKYVNVFNDSIDIVLELLESDIWLRFTKTDYFYEAMTEHRKGSLGVSTASNNRTIQKQSSIIKITVKPELIKSDKESN